MQITKLHQHLFEFNIKKGAFFLLFALNSNICHSAIITYNFSGVISNVLYADDKCNENTGYQCTPVAIDLGASAATIGESFSGSFTIDTNTTDTGAAGRNGGYRYSTAPYGISMNINNTIWKTDITQEYSGFNVIVQNDYFNLGEGTYDALSLGGTIENNPQITALPNTINDATMGLSFKDSTASVFSDNSLPTSFNLDDFDYIYANIRILADDYPFRYYSAGGYITNITAVPVPTAIWLLISGIVPLFITGFRNRNRSQI